MKRGKSPTKEQKDWHGWLAEKGCCITGKPGQIHHPLGSTAKHNKIHIGQWFVICLAPEFHQYGTYARHANPFAFAHFNSSESPLQAEKKLFIPKAIEYGLESEIINTILDYHR